MDDGIPRCKATKRDGCLCRRIVSPTATRCGIHTKTYNNIGPRQFVYREIAYKRTRMLRTWRLLHMEVDIIGNVYNQVITWDRIARATFHNMTDDAIANLLSQRGAWYIRGHVEPITEDGHIIIPPPVVEPPPNTTELGAFALDKQNIHRKATVDQTTEIVQRVLKIPVPEKYRWNTETLSKTPGKIIVSCKLTPLAGAVMIDKYSRDDDVYELGRGIYGKVLDSVWQYISNSSDKEQLCSILKQELQDNIGMCAQGNLSRLCNALVGYMEGIGPQESISERLGREFPKLLEIEDETQRIETAKKILNEVQLPTSDWDVWLDALK